MDRGYVIEESCAVGQIVQNNYPKVNQQQLQIPDELLFQSKIQRLINYEWKVIQIATLTTQHFIQYPIRQITKLKLKKQGQLGQVNFVMKVVLNGKKDQFFAIPIQSVYQWFYKTFWAVMLSKSFQNDPNEEFINSCDGEIMKKGQILGGWEPRYVLITLADGLMSFKNKTQNPTLRIKQTTEVWSRFEIIKQNSQNWVVIKLWHGFVKEEFGVPVYRSTKWAKAFYSLLRIQGN